MTSSSNHSVGGSTSLSAMACRAGVGFVLSGFVGIEGDISYIGITENKMETTIG